MVIINKLQDDANPEDDNETNLRMMLNFEVESVNDWLGICTEVGQLRGQIQTCRR